MGSGYKATRTGMDGLAQRFKSIQKAQEQLNRRITALGIQIDPNGNMTLGTGQTLTIDGDEVVTGALEVSGSQTVSGSLTVTGDTVIDGNLAVPNGSITNDALANPVSFSSDTNGTTGFSVPTAGHVIASIDLPIPAGYTSVLINVMALVSAQNTGAADSMTVECNLDVAGYGPTYNVVGAGANQIVFCAAQYGGSVPLSDFPSGTTHLPFQCIVGSTGHAWSAAGGNVVNLTGTATFIK